MLRYINFFSLLFLLHWLLIWGSINTSPSEIFSFGKSLIHSVNSLRIILPLSFSVLISIYFIYILFTKKIKIKKIHLYFCAILIFQLIGLYLNNERFFLYFGNEKYFDMNNINLIIFSFSVIFFFILCEYHRLNHNIYKYFFAISLLFLFIGFILSVWPKLAHLRDLNLYDAFNPDRINILQQSAIRITGLSRILAVINLFIILYSLNLKNIYQKKILELLIIINTLLLLFMQSRGTLICYFVSLAFIIFIIEHDRKNFKTKSILLFVIIPLFLYFFVSNLVQKNLKKEENAIAYNRILTADTSGRTSIWSHTLKNYEYKKIFGYGPNGDRFFLKDFDKKENFGDNTSNIFLYTLVSGGLVSLIFLILIFFNFFLTIKKFIENKNLYRYSLVNNLSIVYMVFFSIRSIFENSFGLYSVDFLITYLSLSYFSNLKRV